jgi:hypothetical protein
MPHGQDFETGQESGVISKTRPKAAESNSSSLPSPQQEKSLLRSEISFCMLVLLLLHGVDTTTKVMQKILGSPASKWGVGMFNFTNSSVLLLEQLL